MANMHDMVAEFMTAMNQDMGEEVKFRAELLRIRLITEEANEVAQAIYGHDMVEAVDGLCDLLYVTLGTFIAFGFTSEQVGLFFAEVHRSNMMKTGGGLDAFGKVQKPPHWTPPAIAEMLETLMYESVVSARFQDTDHVIEWPPMGEEEAAEFEQKLKRSHQFHGISVQRRQKKIS